eukprot:SAG22_NODE_219_length_14877_cov_14.334619_11_plen_69_part_00
MLRAKWTQDVVVTAWDATRPRPPVPLHCSSAGPDHLDLAPMHARMLAVALAHLKATAAAHVGLNSCTT